MDKDWGLVIRYWAGDWNGDWGLEIEIGYRDLGLGIGDWGLGLEIGIRDWD